MTNNINQPSHYRQHPSGIESIQVAELGGFTLGNAIKYLFRYPYKGQAVDDLKKARFYLQRFNATEADRVRIAVLNSPPECDYVAEVLTHEPAATPLNHTLWALAFAVHGDPAYDKEIALAIHAIEEELNDLEETE